MMIVDVYPQGKSPRPKKGPLSRAWNAVLSAIVQLVYHIIYAFGVAFVIAPVNIFKRVRDRVHGVPFSKQKRLEMLKKRDLCLRVLDAHRDLFGKANPDAHFTTIDKGGNIIFRNDGNCPYLRAWNAGIESQKEADKALTFPDKYESEYYLSGVAANTAHLIYANNFHARDAALNERHHSLSVDWDCAAAYRFASEKDCKCAELPKMVVCVASAPCVPFYLGFKTNSSKKRFSKGHERETVSPMMVTIAPKLIEKNDETRYIYEELISLPFVKVIYDEREHPGLYDITWGETPDESEIVFKHATAQMLVEEMAKVDAGLFGFNEPSAKKRKAGWKTKVANYAVHMLYLSNDEQRHAKKHAKFLKEYSFMNLKFQHARIDQTPYHAPIWQIGKASFEELRGGDDVSEELIVAYERSQWLPHIVDACIRCYANGDKDVERELYKLLIQDVEAAHDKILLQESIELYLDGVPLEDIVA